jgi:dTDP-4-dehydrorhamnose 3,5-epimerase-like enzyme
VSGVRVERLIVHEDGRGWVVEPLEPEAFGGQKNAHLALSLPGVVRGNHLHREGTEVLTVRGPALVRTRSSAVSTDVEVPEGSVFRFTIPPGVSHAVRNTGAEPSVLVSFNTRRHEPDDPDVFPDPIL